MLMKLLSAPLHTPGAVQKRAVFTTVALGAVTLLALPARADTFTLNGNVTVVTAELNITNLTPTQLTFSFANTTPAATPSRLTGFGFELPTSGPFTLVSGPAGSNFTFSTNPGNVPQFNTAVLDFALVTGNDFTGGNPPSGLANGQSSGFFTIGGNFSGLSQLTVAQGAYARFQAIGPGDGSDVAHTLTNPVPEPGEWAVMGMVGTSLLGLMVRARRRNARKRAEA